MVCVSSHVMAASYIMLIMMSFEYIPYYECTYSESTKRWAEKGGRISEALMLRCPSVDDAMAFRRPTEASTIRP
jgi:hypothetical protein